MDNIMSTQMNNETKLDHLDLTEHGGSPTRARIQQGCVMLEQEIDAGDIEYVMLSADQMAVLVSAFKTWSEGGAWPYTVRRQTPLATAA